MNRSGINDHSLRAETSTPPSTQDASVSSVGTAPALSSSAPFYPQPVTCSG